MKQAILAALVAFPLLAGAQEPKQCVSPDMMIDAITALNEKEHLVSAIIVSGGDHWDRFKTFMKTKLKLQLTPEAETSDTVVIFVAKAAPVGSLVVFKDGCEIGHDQIPMLIFQLFIEDEKSKVPV